MTTQTMGGIYKVRIHTRAKHDSPQLCLDNIKPQDFLSAASAVKKETY
jgi:hypothetical protein